MIVYQKKNDMFNVWDSCYVVRTRQKLFIETRLDLFIFCTNSQTMESHFIFDEPLHQRVSRRVNFGYCVVI
jgi:hypothetical protein